MAAEQPPDRHSDFLRLYNAAQPLLRGWLLAWLTDFHLAEDVLQETSLVLWQRFDDFRREQSFEAWALGIARNHMLKAWNRAKRVRPLPDPELLDAMAASFDKAAPQLDRRRGALSGCMEKLSGPLRRLVDLYFGRSLSMAEIAQRTGRSAGGVKVSMFRARQWLAGCVESALKTEAP